MFELHRRNIRVYHHTTRCLPIIKPPALSGGSDATGRGGRVPNADGGVGTHVGKASHVHRVMVIHQGHLQCYCAFTQIKSCVCVCVSLDHVRCLQ